MSIRRIITSAVLLAAATAFSVFAQDGAAGSIFGNIDQPGMRLHTNIVAKVEAGVAVPNAIDEAVESSMTDNDNTLNGESKAAVAFDIPITMAFFTEMVDSNSLIEVTKVLIETNPDKAVHIITLGAVLYPDYAQEVFDGAALTGVMAPDDILVAVLQAGVDPTTVSDATAAGATAAAPATGIVPLGTGIGAGGTGGGDTTASTN